MIVYQVLNEQNQVYTEFTDYNKALNSAQDLTLWDEYHYYRCLLYTSPSPRD